MSSFLRSMLIIAAYLVIVANMFGCSKQEKDAPAIQWPDDFVSVYTENFEVNNTAPLDELLTQSYDLQSLNDFFGRTFSLSDKSIFAANNTLTPTFNEVNLQFPVQCVRYHNHSHYSVYKVTEGGYYYVFWSVPILAPAGLATPQSEREIRSFASFYIYNSQSASAFESIVKKHSTALDIFKIDPNTELDLWSSTTSSYSLLNDGRVVVVDYAFNKHENLNLSDLIVQDIAIYQSNSVASSLSAINTDDLP